MVVSPAWALPSESVSLISHFQVPSHCCSWQDFTRGIPFVAGKIVAFSNIIVLLNTYFWSGLASNGVHVNLAIGNTLSTELSKISKLPQHFRHLVCHNVHTRCQIYMSMPFTRAAQRQETLNPIILPAATVGWFHPLTLNSCTAPSKFAWSHKNHQIKPLHYITVTINCMLKFSEYSDKWYNCFKKLPATIGEGRKLEKRGGSWCSSLNLSDPPNEVHS